MEAASTRKILLVRHASESERFGALALPLWPCRQPGPFGADLDPTVLSLSHSMDDISLCYKKASIFYSFQILHIMIFFCTFMPALQELIPKLEVGFRVTRYSWQGILIKQKERNHYRSS